MKPGASSFFLGCLLAALLAAPTLWASDAATKTKGTPPPPECIVAFKNLSSGNEDRTIAGTRYFLDDASGLSEQEVRTLVVFRAKRLRRADRELDEEDSLRLVGSIVTAFGRRFPNVESCSANCRALYLALETLRTPEDVTRAVKLFKSGTEREIADFVAEKRRELLKEDVDASPPPPPVVAAPAHSGPRVPNPPPPPAAPRDVAARPKPRDAKTVINGLRIETVDRAGGLELNGGKPFPLEEFVPVAEDKLKIDERLELEAARMLSEQGEKFLGVGDKGVGRTLFKDYDKRDAERRTPSICDLLSVVEVDGSLRFRLREAKSGFLASEHGIDKALRQLRAGLFALHDRAYEAMALGAKLDRLEIVVPERSFNRERSRFGRELGPGRYELLTKGQPTYFFAEGSAYEVTVIVVPDARAPASN